MLGLTPMRWGRAARRRSGIPKQPELLYSVGKPGRVVGGFNLRSWPTVRDDTRLRQLGHNAAVFVEEAVRGDDGEDWYRIGDDEYVNASGVKLPRNPPQYFRGAGLTWT